MILWCFYYGKYNMKHDKLFFCVCGLVFIVTAGLVALIVLDVCNITHLTTTVLLFVCGAVLVMGFVCFCCGCIIQTIYDDWKWRRTNKHGRWK